MKLIMVNLILCKITMIYWLIVVDVTKTFYQGIDYQDLVLTHESGTIRFGSGLDLNQGIGAITKGSTA